MAECLRADKELHLLIKNKLKELLREYGKSSLVFLFITCKKYHGYMLISNIPHCIIATEFLTLYWDHVS